MLHRISSRLVGSRTPLGNQIRGLLAEYGIIAPPHLSSSEDNWSTLTTEPHSQLTSFAQELFFFLTTNSAVKISAWPTWNVFTG